MQIKKKKTTLVLGSLISSLYVGKMNSSKPPAPQIHTYILLFLQEHKMIILTEKIINLLFSSFTKIK